MVAMSHWLQRIAPRPRASSLTGGVSYSAELPTRANYMEPLRMIYDHELILYEKGDFVVECEGAPAVKCPARSFIIIPPGRMHVERSVAAGNGHRHWCHFDWVYLPDHAQTPVITFAPGQPRYSLCRPAPDFVPSEILCGRVSDLKAACVRMRRIAKLVQAGSEAALLEARVELLGLLVQLLAGTSVRPADAPAVQGLASRIRQVLDRAMQPEAQTQSLPSMLSSLGCSYEHLCRVFRATYGIGPLQYLLAKRIARAQVLLRTPALTVSEVGRQVGFGNPAYFIKIFRQHTGLTPGQYRVSAHLHPE